MRYIGGSSLSEASYTPKKGMHACFDKLEWEMYLYKHKAVPCEYGDITFFKLGKAVVGILAIYKDKTMLFWDKE